MPTQKRSHITIDADTFWHMKTYLATMFTFGKFIELLVATHTAKECLDLVYIYALCSVKPKHMPNIHVVHFFFRLFNGQNDTERPISMCNVSGITDCVTLIGTTHTHTHIVHSMIVCFLSCLGIRTFCLPYKSVGNGAAAATVERNGSRFGNMPFVFSPARILFIFSLRLTIAVGHVVVRILRYDVCHILLFAFVRL